MELCRRPRVYENFFCCLKKFLGVPSNLVFFLQFVFSVPYSQSIMTSSMTGTSRIPPSSTRSPSLSEHLSAMADSRLSALSFDVNLDRETKRIANLIEIETSHRIQLCTDVKSGLLTDKAICVPIFGGDWKVLAKVAEKLMLPPFGFDLVRPRWACRCRMLYGYQREDEPDMKDTVCEQRHGQSLGKCGPQYLDVFFKPMESSSSSPSSALSTPPLS
jgi:hypothetical protein